LRIQKHPERILYKHAEEKNFNIYRGQIAFRLKEEDKDNNHNISTCLNGKGKLISGNKKQWNRIQNTILSLWNNMEIIGIIRTGLDITDFKKQAQINVIIHGDANVYNNSIEAWFPNQRLIAVLPSPNLQENIRFEEFPDDAFYPILEPFDCVKHTRYITDLIHAYLVDNNYDNRQYYPNWIREIAEKQWKLDTIKYFILNLNQENINVAEINENTIHFEKRKNFYSNINLEVFAEPFIAYEKAYAILNEKIVGKVVHLVKIGEMGTIIVNNIGSSKNISSFSPKDNKKKNFNKILNNEESSDDEL